MFKLSPKAQKHIAAKGGSIIVKLEKMPIGDCWDPAKREYGLVPVVEPGSPPNAEKSQYVQEMVEGITVWYDPDVKLAPGEDSAFIDLQNFIIFKKLDISGTREIPLPGAGEE